MTGDPNTCAWCGAMTLSENRNRCSDGLLCRTCMGARDRAVAEVRERRQIAGANRLDSERRVRDRAEARR